MRVFLIGSSSVCVCACMRVYVCVCVCVLSILMYTPLINICVCLPERQIHIRVFFYGYFDNGLITVVYDCLGLLEHMHERVHKHTA